MGMHWCACRMQIYATGESTVFSRFAAANLLAHTFCQIASLWSQCFCLEKAALHLVYVYVNELDDFIFEREHACDLDIGSRCRKVNYVKSHPAS